VTDGVAGQRHAPAALPPGKVDKFTVYINALLRINCVISKRSNSLFQDHNISTIIAQHCTKHLAYTYISENELHPTTAVQQKRHVDAVGCGTFFFSSLVSMFASDILQIPSGNIQICSGLSASTCTPLGSCDARNGSKTRNFLWFDL